MAFINGGPAPDALTGTSGYDTITLGADQDVYAYSAGGVDVILDFGAIYFSGIITGSQEVPANSSTAAGTVSGFLRRDAQGFTFTATIAGLDLGGQTAATIDNVSAAHFHAAPPGVNGGVVFGFIGLPNNDLDGDTAVTAALGRVTGQWDVGEGNAGTTLTAQLSNLLGGRVYINFHTAAFAGGEIRGQMLPVDSGHDRIDLRQLGITDWEGLQLRLSEFGGSARINTVTGDQAHMLVLAGVPVAALSPADFIFTPKAPHVPYSLSDLTTAFVNMHAGRAPSAAQTASLSSFAQQSQAGQLTDAQTLAKVAGLADGDTAVALGSYAFFTGLTPNASGLSWLVNSPVNGTDLNDPFFQALSVENRYINFAVNLGALGAGAPAFQTAYGARTFSQAVDAAYDAIIGLSAAQTAGVNTASALADIKARLPYFQQIAAQAGPGVNQDLATKAAAVGYILAEANKADVGLYATATNNFLIDAADGMAQHNVNLVGVYGG
jgi:hypothetical protein